MNRKLNWYSGILSFVLIGSLSFACSTGQKTFQNKELSQGQMLASSCYTCHGTDGKSTGTIPSLAEKSPEEIKNALMEFKADKKESTMMSRHAKGYTDEEIVLISEAFRK